jgi:DNA-3-methyladenine glycosylase
MSSPDIALWLSRPAWEVAPQLLGCTLVRTIDGIEYRAMIVETEAYDARTDPACHAYKKRSDRNAVMFGAAGLVYVYLIYGIHHCINLVTDQAGIASAVLIRAICLEQVPPWIDARKVSHHRNHSAKSDRLGAGPGKLCKVLKIDRSLNGETLAPKSPLSLEIHPLFPEIIQTTRIGISQGIDIPWRWYIANHPDVSVF